MKPQITVDTKCRLGEGPLWHPLENNIYWLDILEGIIYRYDPQTSLLDEIYDGDITGGFTFQEDGSLLLFMEKGCIKLYKDGKLTTLIDEIPELKDTRFNDVIADPAGRVFCGTMPDSNGEAYLYRLDTDGSIKQILDGVGLSNGMAFTLDKKQMYYTDSGKNEIYLFDYNIADGSLSNKRLFLKVEEEEGIVADGLTMDSEGYVWSARWNGGCVKRFTPEGKLNLTIDFPARKITSLTFGGKYLSEIYITSAAGDQRPEEGDKAGALFTVNVGIKGLPEYFSKIRL